MDGIDNAPWRSTTVLAQPQQAAHEARFGACGRMGARDQQRRRQVQGIEQAAGALQAEGFPLPSQTLACQWYL